MKRFDKRKRFVVSSRKVNKARPELGVLVDGGKVLINIRKLPWKKVDVFGGDDAIYVKEGSDWSNNYSVGVRISAGTFFANVKDNPKLQELMIRVLNGNVIKGERVIIDGDEFYRFGV